MKWASPILLQRRLLLVVLLVLGVSYSAAAIEVGMSAEDLLQEQGEPLGRIQQRDSEVYLYQGGGVTVRDGKVVEVEEGFKRRDTKRAEAKAFEEAQRAKGLVLYKGQWVTPTQKVEFERQDALIEAAQKRQDQRDAQKRADWNARRAAARRHGRGGKIDLSKVLVPGKYTVIDFYADWCGPCRKMAPALNELMKQHPGAVLRKVNIVKWESPVAKQFSIKSIPSVWVYGPDAKLVGPPTSDLRVVARMLSGSR